jgi:transcriptional regulator GlxA family with amidase domain
MKHVSILVPNGNHSVVNIMGTQQILQVANERFAEQFGRKLFEIDLVGFAASYAVVAGAAQPMPTKLWTEVSQTDIVILPAVYDDPDEAIQKNQSLLAFLVEQYKSGATLVSMCIGTYVLAATGLLDGKVCSTHWLHASRLKEKFPNLLVREEKLIAEQAGIITCGGAYAFPNLILYLVEKFGGRELAIFLAKTFMIDLDRTRQSPYIMFQGYKEHADEMILKVQDYIEHNYAEKFTVEDLASHHHLVRRTLERRFKAATGYSILEYVQRIRMETAKKDLEIGRKSVTEIMYDCGYQDSKAFRDVFRKYAGVSPLEYRHKYSKEQHELRAA